MNKAGLAVIFCVVSLIPTASIAQQDSLITSNDTAYRSKLWFKTKGYRINKMYLKSLVTDLPRVATTPARYTRKDWRNVAIVVGGTGAFLLADRGIQKVMLANQTEFLNAVSKVVEPFGNRFPPLIIGGLYAAGVITKSRRIEHASLVTAKSLMYSTVFYAATKSLIRRQRPKYTDNPFVFKAPFQGGKEYTSFPSGHTNTVFTVMTALAIEFKHTKWVPPLAYSIATITALSRLYENRHWGSDVWVGAAFGHFITKALYKVEEQKYRKKTLYSLSF